MSEHDLKRVLRLQLHHLEDLVIHLEDRGMIGSDEYRYCQARLQEVLEQLKRIERVTESKDCGT